MNSTIASAPDNPTTRDTTSKCTPPQCIQTLKTSQPLQSTYRSEAHERLLKQTNQEAHTTEETTNKGTPSAQTQAIASLCLHKPWRQTPRPSLKPLYLEATTLPIQHTMRTRSISATHSTSPSGEHQEGQAAQEAQEHQEHQVTPMETQTDQERYPSLILFPSNPQEISNLLGSHPYSLTETELAQTPSLGNFEFT